MLSLRMRSAPASRQVAKQGKVQSGRRKGKLKSAPRRTRLLKLCLGKDANTSYH